MPYSPDILPSFGAASSMKTGTGVSFVRRFDSQFGVLGMRHGEREIRCLALYIGGREGLRIDLGIRGAQQISFH